MTCLLTCGVKVMKHVNKLMETLEDDGPKEIYTTEVAQQTNMSKLDFHGGKKSRKCIKLGL